MKKRWLPLLAMLSLPCLAAPVLEVQTSQQCPWHSKDAGVKLVQRAADWQALFPFDAAAADAVFLQPLDWSRQLVVIATLGARPGGGYSLTLQRSRFSQGSLSLYVRELKPATGAINTLALSEPCALLRVQRKGLRQVRVLDADNNRLLNKIQLARP
ncbi:protease complex subunit PrcB family protein [Uliginosibacterium sediminicola]|uniref:Protease complex subunit PrcB family protein n=1 Tax=Uliginosibacterium sediminicola TaxID=2024550 RepID=A0ABU9YYB3_9RHOO